MNRIRTLLPVALGAGLVTFSAMAIEMPTDAQKEAIKSDCRDDFIKYCKGVEPGGLPALECLEKNMSSLTEACQAAVSPVEQETGTGGG